VSTRASLLACAIAMTALAWSTGGAARATDHAAHSRQAKVHGNAHEVMPFDIARVEHVFRMAETGGTMRVVLRDPADTGPLAGIRSHLHEQAARFAAGDFAAPSHLHGPDMPGLAELQAGAGKLRVAYEELPDGAQIRFTSEDAGVVTAVHRWFGAQLSEHGADARAE